jgi:mannose-1-phosphate guanylyltransferase
MSRAARPKQFLNLTGDDSLFQQALHRTADPHRYSAPIVITHSDYRFLVAEQAAQTNVTPAAILLEPVARNTAVAIAAAAIVARSENEDAVLHVLASDAAVDADANYFTAVDAAALAAREGWLVTFGVQATRPETGYGYIEVGREFNQGVCLVDQFIEKPDQAAAEAMLRNPKFVWNTGMFVFSAASYLDECGKLAPDTLAAAQEAVANASQDLDFIRLDLKALESAPDKSVDYAIFEKTKKAAVLPVNFYWSDLGSWASVWKASTQDEKGNVAVGPSTLHDTSNSMVLSESAHVVVDGHDDLLVIATDDALLVGRLSQSQNVGPLVRQLAANDETVGLTKIHRTAYRPWGGYSSVLMGERFQVKRLFVHPGKKLSLQKHHHRAEHWIVVSGTAEVTIDGDTRVLSENQSIYLPLGCVHRLSNPGKILLELIEVQTGSYLGEDDIIRIEDEFGRAGL